MSNIPLFLQQYDVMGYWIGELSFGPSNSKVYCHVVLHRNGWKLIETLPLLNRDSGVQHG